MAETPPAVDLDVRGLFCPLPVILAQRALDPLPAGARVTVLGDDPAIHGDVPAWCAESGHRLIELVELGGDEIRFVVEKAAAGRAARSRPGAALTAAGANVRGWLSTALPTETEK